MRYSYLARQSDRMRFNSFIAAIPRGELPPAGGDLSAPTNRLALQSAAARLLARAQARRAQQAPSAGGTMELGRYLEHVCAAVSKARLAERGAWLALTADEVWLDVDRCWLVGLIIAELINTFVCPGLSGGTGAIPVRIVDGGWRMVGAVAIPGHARAAEGRRRRLVEALSAELGGAVEWASVRNGCCAWFEFPIERPAPSRQAASRHH